MSVKEYFCSDTTQLSPHFNISEFCCKCGKNHSTLLSDNLVQMLEKLFSALDCSKIIVTSGYRCPEHDKAVGGSGSGQHTKGTAADVCCYGQNGSPISSRIVSCKAQDLGFTGIANITDSYQYTHLDVRTNGKYYGNEVYGTSTVTSDFYSYYGISKNMTNLKGIDVSKHNGSIDWKKVRDDGVQFAILRAGYGKIASQKDAKFEEYYSGAKSAGVPVGAYWYSYAATADEAKQEAEACISVLKGKQFEFPVYFDLEEQSAFDTGKANCSAMVRAFCEVLEKAGYWTGLYMSRSPFTDYMEADIKTRYALWLAEYNTKLNYDGEVGMWQKSSTGKVNGISGNVDLDECYVDYPAKMKSAGLNGYSSSDTQTIAEPDEKTVLDEILETVKRIDSKLD